MIETENEKHGILVMETYISLPDVELTNNKVYDDLINTLNQFDDKVSNEEMLHTLKLILIQLCEKCANYIETKQYESIQEKYK